MVGSYAPGVFSDYELILTDSVECPHVLDVREPADVRDMVGDAKPDVVLHLAAATDVDRCEKEPDWAYHSNAIGTQNVVYACREFDTTLVYISTAGVFWGDKADPYIEFDEPRPANVYGHSKLAGERYVAHSLRKYFIARAGWMVGGGRKDKKFVGQIARLITEGRTKLKAVDDKLGSPTYAKDLLVGIEKLLGTELYGLYHMVNEGVCSRYEVALEIKDIIQNDDVSIEPVSSAHFPLPAPRARSEAMRNLKLELLKIHRMPSWQAALREYVSGELMPALEAKEHSE
jgi:dTDP-4-dehydrorhamnose reductase